MLSHLSKYNLQNMNTTYGGAADTGLAYTSTNTWCHCCDFIKVHECLFWNVTSILFEFVTSLVTQK